MITNNRDIIYENNDLKVYSSKWIFLLMIIYFLMSYFEGYINVLLGPISKYFIITLVFVLFVSMLENKVRVQLFAIYMLFWLVLKNVSLLWGGSSFLGMEVVKAHFFSQILMVCLLVTLSMMNFEQHFVDKIIDINMYMSGILATLALFFSEPFQESFTARLTLTIYGVQMDPNDLSAFYIISVVIALYKIINKKGKKILSIYFMIVGILAMGLTSSRGGLVSLIAVIVIMAIYSGRDRIISWKRIRTLVSIIVLSIITYYLSKHFLPVDTFNRLFVDSYEGGSGRMDLWIESLYAFSQKPIFGNGWGGTYYRVHNTYLNIMVDNGISGLLLFLAAIILVIKKAFRKGEVLAIYLIGASLFPAFFVEGITKRFFWNGLILAILIINKKDEQKRE